jgi:hypothetical protein
MVAERMPLSPTIGYFTSHNSYKFYAFVPVELVFVVEDFRIYNTVTRKCQ